MPSIAIGTTVLGPDQEPFKVTDFLGNGAFGEVYRAVGLSSRKIVAAKLLPIRSLPSEHSKIALLNEIKTAQRVQHPNVVQILYVNETAASPLGPYVLMEYISGGTLAQLIQSHKQSGTQIALPRAIAMMSHLAHGAQAINKTVIHRDIKPDNVLLEADVLKIGDFGISKFVDETTRQHTFKGRQHVAYMAPECWQDHANTFKVDVYSVGLLFYEILTLQHPLASKVSDANDFLQWQQAHLFEQCPDVRLMRSDVPTSIAQLLFRMVSKRPQDRPNWEEVIRILSEPEITAEGGHPSIKAAVEAAIGRKREQEQSQLQASRRQHERERQVGLYQFSCDTLLNQLTSVIEDFNRQFQHGQITSSNERGFVTFKVPMGHSIHISFFEPRETRIKIRGGELIGGGWIGLYKGRSANLVLLRQGPDDLYGRWAVCEIKIMALADPQRLIGRFGLAADTVVPFGFKDAYFYDQIQYSTGALHVFTYHFSDDVPGYFANLLLDACNSKGN